MGLFGKKKEKKSCYGNGCTLEKLDQPAAKTTSAIKVLGSGCPSAMRWKMPPERRLWN